MIEVQEHRPGTKSYSVLRRELRAYNRSHPKPHGNRDNDCQCLGCRMPPGWWIAPGLFVAILIVIAVLVSL